MLFVVGACSAGLVAAEGFEGTIAARLGSAIERYSIQGQRIRFESEDRGRISPPVIVDFAAKKKFLVYGGNTSQSYELWGDDLDPPPRAASRDGSPMKPATDTGVTARVTGRTTTIAGFDAEEFVEDYGDNQAREIWATKALGLSPLAIRRLREGSSMVHGFIDERLIEQGYFPLRITQRGGEASPVLRYEVVAIERKPLASGVFDPGHATAGDKKLPFWYFTTGTLVEVAALKRPTERDVLWAYLAFELNEPAFCERIAANAFVSAGLFAGHLFNQIGLFKSDCYTKIAVQYRLPQLCDKVVSIRTAYDGGDYYSGATCREHLGSSGSTSVSQPDRHVLIELFGQLRYSAETLHTEGLTRPFAEVVANRRDQELYQRYYRLKDEKDIIERIARVDAYPTVPLEQKEFLYHLAAVAATDAQWCRKIRPDRPMPWPSPEDRFFADVCVANVASAAKRPMSCDEIRNRVEYHTSYSENVARDRCRRLIGASVGGFRTPPSKETVNALLAALGSPQPKPAAPSEDETAEYFLEFISRLADGRAESLTSQAARQKFVARALSINVR